MFTKGKIDCTMHIIVMRALLIYTNLHNILAHYASRSLHDVWHEHTTASQVLCVGLGTSCLAKEKNIKNFENKNILQYLYYHDDVII